MKLRTQIFSGYVLLALLVLAVGATAYLGLRAIAADFDRAINQTQPVLTALQTIRVQATTLALKAERGARGRTPASRDEDTIAELNATVARYRELVVRHFPGELDDAVAIEARVTALGRLVAPQQQLSHDTPEPADAGRSTAIARELDALQEALANAAAGEEAELRERQANIQTDTALHLSTIIAVCVLSLLAALGGGAVLSARIAQPVRELRKAAKRLGRGLLDTRVTVASTNELGELADAFNQMADDLTKSLVSRDYVESIVESLAEGVVVVDEHGTIERSNSAMRRLFDEAAMGPLEGRPLREVFRSGADLDTALAGPHTRQGFECRLEREADSPSLVAVSVSPVMLGANSRGRVLLVQDITERKRQEERLSYLASYDVLTGLPNRRMFLDHLRNTLARLPWNQRHVGLLFCDLDRFKFVNDSLGHAIGDLLLQRITERLRSVLRPGDIVGRWAGDEFVVMLDELAEPEHVDAIAGKIVEHLRQPVQIGPHELHATVSVGSACAPGDARDADELVKNADLAMYAAKAAGKNVHYRYAAEMRSRTELRLMLEHALRHAIDARDQLLVHYQPQQDLDGELLGFEALVRWQHPQLGLISPAQFLPAAEEAGLMAALDESVLRMACAELRAWRETGWTALRMAVNVSNQSFRRGDLVDVVARTIDESGIPAGALELELTEDIVMENVGSAVEKMEQLCALGVQLSIDDFGTGYSSLSQLKRCPIGVLKIDRSFITDVIHDESDRAITHAIIALAHKLGIKVLAEGVETEAQLALLRSAGCDAMQGYLLSRPIPADAARTWLAARRG